MLRSRYLHNHICVNCNQHKIINLIKNQNHFWMQLKLQFVKTKMTVDIITVVNRNMPYINHTSILIDSFTKYDCCVQSIPRRCNGMIICLPLWQTSEHLITATFLLLNFVNDLKTFFALSRFVVIGDS